MDKLDCILDSCSVLGARMDAIELKFAREELSRGDDFNEADHPRASDGKFGSGGAKRSPEAARKTIGYLETLANHPNTPKHEAAAARGRIAILKEKYAPSEPAKPSYKPAKPSYKPAEPAKAYTASKEEIARHSGVRPHPSYTGPQPSLHKARTAMQEAAIEYHKHSEPKSSDPESKTKAWSKAWDNYSRTRREYENEWEKDAKRWRGES